MASFWGEIKRRKVFQVAAVYAVVSWLLVQVVATVEQPLSLPPWFATVVIVSLAIGFPVAVILAWAFDVTPQGIRVSSEPTPSGSAAQPSGQRLGYLMQALVLLAVSFLVINQFLSQPGSGLANDDVTSIRADSETRVPTIQRFRTSLGEFEPVADGLLSTDIAISPDGRSLVYVASLAGQAQLYFRSLDQFETRPLPGTDGAFRPFFSPDGEWVGFYSDQSDQKLKKISIRGGAPFTLTDASLASGADWSIDGTIVYVTGSPSPDVANGRSLFRIPATGGQPELLVAADQEQGYGTPHVLPGGEAALVVVRFGAGGSGSAEDGRIDVLSLTTGEAHTIIEAGFAPKYVASGHIVFYRGDGLWAVPFDVSRLETIGREVPVIDGVQADNLRGYVPYAITDEGLLVYVAGAVGATDVDSDIGLQRTLLWVDRNGNEELVATPPRRQLFQSLSPDGQRVALSVNVGNNGWDIWITDLSRGTSSRLTFDSGDELNPIWTPDGQRVAFFGGQGISWISANGTGQVESIAFQRTSSRPRPISFLPDGSLAIVEGTRLRILPMNGGSLSTPLLETTPPEFLSSISPDNNWIAYESNETGQLEIYVRPFPNVDGGKWQISSDGGEMPRWAPEGTEIFYRNGDAMMAVSVATAQAFSMETPVKLFEGNYDSGARPDFDVSSDGRRFLMLPNTVSRLGRFGVEERVYLSVVYNWFEELRRLAPADE